MRQVVGQILLSQIRPVWVKGSFNSKNGAKKEENRLTSEILDKNHAKYNFYGSGEGSSTCKYIGQKVKLGRLITVKGVKSGNT